MGNEYNWCYIPFAVINVSPLWSWNTGLQFSVLMDILIAKKCCGQGYQSALKLKNYFESKGKPCNIYGKKWQNLSKLLNQYGMVFNEKENQAIIIVNEIGLCLKEKEISAYIERDKIHG